MADYFELLQRLADRDGGHTYSWRSRLGDRNGEDAYTALVKAHLFEGATVLEAGCGHGPDLAAFAPGCARYIGYDAVADFITAAGREAERLRLANVELVAMNSSAAFNSGRARMPAEDRSLDLVISRRGPGNWIEDARRACKPGAVLLQLNPGPWQAPAWSERLPQGLRFSEALDIEAQVRGRLAAAGIPMHSVWTFDVPELIDDARELFNYVTWLRDDPPTLDALQPLLQSILEEAGGCVDVRQKRFMWKAVVD
jgi:SAM-dependent methyltransferase